MNFLCEMEIQQCTNNVVDNCCCLSFLSQFTGITFDFNFDLSDL